MTIWNKTVR